MTTMTEAPTDQQIREDVTAELDWDPELQPHHIGVVVEDGVVTLTGWVDNYVKKWEAEEAALRVRGVVAVADEVEVRLPHTAVRDDADLAADVARALEWDAMVPPGKVDAVVSNGWVTLRGEVGWHFQRRNAERAVRRLGGVRGITNEISVKPRVQASSEQIRAQVRDALVRNAETDARDIEVEVRGDRVTLRGKVHSWAQRRAAERAAASAPGVGEVDNHLRVALFGN
jgi:osmotically-inducible protein OsmY